MCEAHQRFPGETPAAGHHWTVLGGNSQAVELYHTPRPRIDPQQKGSRSPSLLSKTLCARPGVRRADIHRRQHQTAWQRPDRNSRPDRSILVGTPVRAVPDGYLHYSQRVRLDHSGQSLRRFQQIVMRPYGTDNSWASYSGTTSVRQPMPVEIVAEMDRTMMTEPLHRDASVPRIGHGLQPSRRHRLLVRTGTPTWRDERPGPLRRRKFCNPSYARRVRTVRL